MFYPFRSINYWLLLLLALPFILEAQTPLDSIQALPELEISASVDRHQTIGSNVRSWSDTALSVLPVNNLGELLALETNVYLKSYGLGSLATSSIRGSSAGQTLVLWNGLPLQSPMLGQLDLALLPSRKMEKISLSRGGGSSLWGSGAIGGVLSLDNHPDFRQRFSIFGRTDVGSFGQFQQQLQMAFAGQKWQAGTKLSHQQADNDFNYPLGPGIPERQQTNAALSQQSLLQDIYWKVDKQKTLSAHFWWQKADREIPPTNVQTRSEAYQQDQATRIMLDFTEITHRGKWQIKAGFFDEQLNYYDPQIRLTSESHFQSYLGDVSASWRLGARHYLLVGGTQTYTEARTEVYQDSTPNQWRAALFTSLRGDWRKTAYQLSIRQEMVDGRWIPLTPSLGIDWNFDTRFSLKAKVSRNYRLPTFNDLYWQPGGNPDLLPESGWSQELGLDKVWETGNFTVSTSLTAFNRLIDNWILWSIREDQNFWSANNITRIWSRGLEPRLKFMYALSEGSINWHSGYDYIRSTNQVTLERPRMMAGSQLLYTPEHQFFTKVDLKYKNKRFSYHHRYTGATLGQNEAIPAFQVARLSLGWNYRIRKYQLDFQAAINNLWNKDYVVIERRPMPGRHFQIGIQFSYQQK